VAPDGRGGPSSWETPLEFLMACEELEPAAVAAGLGKPARNDASAWEARLWRLLAARARGTPAQPLPLGGLVLPAVDPKVARRLAQRAACLRGEAAASPGGGGGWEDVRQRRLKIGAWPRLEGGVGWRFGG
jgi:hypothetical protein